ncbi:LacI family DNA-binding transcriptional regulator [Streptomyces sp. NPDC001941]|uniref:LacI family DNA-binding transcriptional regulator n=1 Tax=Streptomyces sp. NPDC001941 TaxID=3154659 RepID=UPI00332CE761
MGEGSAAPTAVTSSDVARLAGVSRATVSFVLNNKQAHRITATTRAKVLAAAQELGYVPHAAARALRAGRSNLVLIPASVSAAGQLVSAWVDALQSALYAHGYTTVLHGARDTDAVAAARAWAEFRPAAVLTLGGEALTEAAAGVLTRAGVRGVLVLGSRPVKGVHTVGFDHGLVGALAVRHLVGRGRTRIGVVMPRERGLATFAVPRLAGARAEAAGAATVTPVEMSYTDRSASELAKRWAESELDAVFAYNDEYATLLLHALRNEGFAVPDDVAVVGADDLVGTTLLQPPLTTVRLGLPAPAVVADALHELIDQGTAPVIPGIEPVLVARGSS